MSNSDWWTILTHGHIFKHCYLWAPAGEPITVEVGDTPGQRAPQHLKFLPADHITGQVLLQGRGTMGLVSLWKVGDNRKESMPRLVVSPVGFLWSGRPWSASTVSLPSSPQLWESEGCSHAADPCRRRYPSHSSRKHTLRRGRSSQPQFQTVPRWSASA